MNVKLRKFERKDIENKVRWINDERNNQYLHYEVPLEYEKTCHWFEAIKDRADRYDAVIEYEGIPVGVIGLLSISEGSAEYYVTMGEPEFKKMGIAREATMLLLEYAFKQLDLDVVYLYTEVENIGAQQLFEHCGFICEEIIRKDWFNRKGWVSRFMYRILKSEYMYSEGG